MTDNSAIAKSQSQLSTSLHGETLQALVQEHERTRKEIVQAVLQLAKWGVNKQYPSGFHLTYEQAQKQASMLASQQIINSLAFPTISDRFEKVPTAFQDTFKWVLDPESHSQTKWSNFCEWLESGNGVYWMNGKAGSGKSTLMKFICLDERTRTHLSKWTGTDQLVFSSFFFWRAGSPLQRSQTGLLRSLLHNIFQEYPQLLEKAFPDKLKTVTAATTDYLYTMQPTSHRGGEISYGTSREVSSLLQHWSLEELGRAMNAIVHQNTLTIKFCFFIDGLDEYDGDHGDIVAIFEEVFSSSNTKICLSSRPLPLFEQTFSHHPGLRLQDLTEGDIRRFIRGRFINHPSMLSLRQKEPQKTQWIIQTIIEKASGVFIWVSLVVKSLIDGVINHDTITDLKERLRQIPPDLDDLYRQMIQKIDPIHRPRASALFQILTQARTPPSSLALSFLDGNFNSFPSTVINAVPRPLSQEERAERIFSFEARVPSISAGLLEVENNSVQFFHRTVLDFCEQEEVSLLLKSFTANTSFNANIAILCCCILELKRIAHIDDIFSEVYWNLLQDGLIAANYAESEGQNLGVDLLDELDRAGRVHWDQYGHGRIVKGPIPPHWSHVLPDRQPSPDKDPFISVAVQYQLTSYLSKKLLVGATIRTPVSGPSLLDVAIPPLHTNHSLQKLDMKRVLPSPITVELLLKHKSDPNRNYEGATPWEIALLNVANFRPNPNHDTPNDLSRFGQTWSTIFHLLISYGANINAEITLTTERSTVQLTALDVVTLILSQYDASGAEELKTCLDRLGAEPKFAANEDKAVRQWKAVGLLPSHKSLSRGTETRLFIEPFTGSLRPTASGGGQYKGLRQAVKNENLFFLSKLQSMNNRQERGEFLSRSGFDDGWG
jgi:hypothetical protein